MAGENKTASAVAEEKPTKVYLVASGRTVASDAGKHLPFDEVEFEVDEGDRLVKLGFLTEIEVKREESKEGLNIQSSEGANVKEAK
ncbi:MAG TPA: hypothetical protein VFM18_08520 [Methanosarcina sp.]|nr:hypothetical protein [Methanosarcina sp.]